MDFPERMTRLRDEFFLVAQARPATADHYLAWLESYLDAGGAVKGLNLEAFPEKQFYTISKDAVTPAMDGVYAFSIIVPPGVKLATGLQTDCKAYIAGDGSLRGTRDVYVWREMLDTAIGDGYSLSQLVSAADLGTCVQVAVVEAIANIAPDRVHDYYNAFSDKATLEQIEGRIETLRATDVTQLARKFLKLEAATPIDPTAQAVIDGQARDAMKTLEMLRYKLDPASAQPIPAFGKRAKPPAPPAEPNVELPGQIQVGPVLRLKDPVTP